MLAVAQPRVVGQQGRRRKPAAASSRVRSRSTSGPGPDVFANDWMRYSGPEVSGTVVKLA